MRELKDQLSAPLARVRRGEAVTVTDRNRVAVIVPARAEAEEDLVVQALVKSGRLAWSGGKPAGLDRAPQVRGLLKLYVREPGTDEPRARVAGASIVATSRVACPEARAALARRQREAGIPRSGLARAVAALDRDLERFVVVELSAKVARRAGELAERRAVRGVDAIHLASALEVGELTGSTPSFRCFDERLRQAVSAEGLSV